MNKIPPRVGMPRISNAAHKTLSTYPEYNNPTRKQPYKSPDPVQTISIEFLIAEKGAILPKLKELKTILDESKAAYDLAYANWNKLAAEYERLDNQEKRILHQKKMAAKAVKKPTTKKSTDAADSAKKLAMKVLASLSPEKQAEILALIQAQANSNK